MCSFTKSDILCFINRKPKPEAAPAQGREKGSQAGELYRPRDIQKEAASGRGLSAEGPAQAVRLDYIVCPCKTHYNQWPIKIHQGEVTVRHRGLWPPVCSLCGAVCPCLPWGCGLESPPGLYGGHTFPGPWGGTATRTPRHRSVVTLY